jgi:hypothetical protein
MEKTRYLQLSQRGPEQERSETQTARKSDAPSQSVEQALDHEPSLPRGCHHIRSAIEALMTP